MADKTASAYDNRAVKEMSRAMALSVAIGFFMLALKIYAYVITGSAAILSDAAESIVHIIAVSFAAYSFWLSLKPADQSHMYGHDRISFFSAGFEGWMIALAALYIIYEATHKWLSGLALENIGTGTAYTSLSVVINGALGWYLVVIGKKYHSLVIEANGKHVLTDSWTSIGVVVGLLLITLTGWLPFDPLIAILVGINILWTGYKLIRRSIAGLMDESNPEIDQQLRQARADLQAAQVNLDFAKTTATRWQLLLQADAVSKQETDQAVGNFNAQKATVEAKVANVRRLEELQGFKKLYAPFAGVVTARNTDLGALIDAGATAPSKELFHLAAIDKLRIYVAVPEVSARAAQPGAAASLTLDEFPGRVFLGTLVRTANAIDPTSRTLLVEVDIDNPSGELLPGTYVLVHLKLPQATHSVTVPANTLLFRSEGLRVGVVRNGRVELAPVTIGRDYGSTVEVVSGLRPDDAVIVNPADSLISGVPVQVNETLLKNS